MSGTASSRVLKVLVAAVVAVVAALTLVACGNTASDGDEVTVKVGASPAPHAVILEAAAPALEAEGITLDIVEYQDYVQPNANLADGELDANYFQHVPYLDDYNEKNGTDLVPVAKVHFEPMGLYAGKAASLDELPDGATIAVPNDTTNEARALLLLQDQGLIKLDESKGLQATPRDITENPKNLEFLELDAPALPRALEDAELAVINANFALGAGVDTSKLLVAESADSLASETYANVLVVRAGEENEDTIKKIAEALHSEYVKKAIEAEYGSAVVPLF